MSNFKRCPFCDEPEKLLFGETPNSDSARVVCLECYAAGPWGSDQTEAIQKWNDAPRKITHARSNDLENERLRKKIHELQNILHRKNQALDALRWVWCSGGCEFGVNRYGFSHLPELTEEVVKIAERNTGRLRTWFTHYKNRQANK